MKPERKSLPMQVPLMQMETKAGKTWRPVVAGILDILAGVFSMSGTLLSIYFAISIVSGRSRLDRELREISRVFPEVLVFLSIVLLVVAIFLVVGGIFSIRRKNWTVAATGSLAAIVFAILAGIPLVNYSVLAVAALAALGLGSLILTLGSKQEFS